MPFLIPLAGLAGGAIAGAVSWLSGGSILAGIVKLGLGLAAKYLLAATNKPKAQSSQLETTYGEDMARSVAMGYVGTAGQRIYRNTYGSGNRHVQDAYVVSHFLGTGISRVRYNGDWHNVATTGEDPLLGFRVLNTEVDLYVKFHRGEMDQVADAGLISKANPHGRWTADHRAAGMSYVTVMTRLDRVKQTTPWEAFFELKPAPLYDFRKDSSIGGDGDHRWDDQSTWEPSENLVLMAYLLERGVYRGTELIVGKGVKASRLPLDKWTIAANICDEEIEGKPRYKGGIIAASGEGITHDQNLDPLLEAMCASWVEDADGEYPIVGAAQASVATITDLDLVSGETRRFSKYRTRSDLVNTVAGKFCDPEAFYATKPFTPKVSAAALAEDGERLAVALSLGAVNSLEVADRVSDITILASRYQASADIVLRPKFIKLKVGQWITWESDLYGTRKFQILTRRLGPIGPTGTRNVFVSLQEVSEDIFDGTEYVTPPTVITLPGAADYQSIAANFQAQGIQVQIAGSPERIPALRFTWNAFDDVTVVAVDVEYRPVADLVTVSVANPAVVGWPNHGLSTGDSFYLATTGALPTGVTAGQLYFATTIINPNSFRFSDTPGGADIVTTGTQSGVQSAYQNSVVQRATVPVQVLVATSGVLADSLYDYRHRIICDPPRATFFTPWNQVSTLPAVVTGVEVGLATVGADTRALLLRMNQSIRDAFARIEQIAVAGVQAATTITKQDSVAVAYQDATAAAMTELSALITQVGDDLIATADALTVVQASVGLLSAGALWRMRAQAGAGDVIAEVVLEVRATTGSAWATAATLWQAGFTGSPPVAFSRMVVKADQFVVTDGTDSGYPLVFEGGVLSLNVANIGTVIAGVLQNALNTMQINLNAGYFSIQVP